MSRDCKKFEDTKEIIRRKSKKDILCKWKIDKRSKRETMIYKTLHRNLKTEQREPHKIPRDELE
jgi:hypothetical protein